MTKLQILASGLAMHWESQRLVWHSTPLMGNWEVGDKRQKRVCTMSCSQKLQPGGSEGWGIHWAAAEDTGQSASQTGKRAGRGNLSYRNGCSAPNLMPFPLTHYPFQAYSSTRKSKWLLLSVCTTTLHRVVEGIFIYLFSWVQIALSRWHTEQGQWRNQPVGEAMVTCSIPLVSLPIALDRHLLCGLFSFLGLSKAPPFVLKQEREHRQ